MNVFQLIVTLVAIVVAGSTPISVAIYLGSRIDRLAERMDQRIGALETELGRFEERTQAGFERIEKALADHAATHAHLAHGRPQP